MGHIPKSYISKRTPVDVDMLPNYDAIYSGFLLKQTSQVWVFIYFNAGTKLFDGYCVFRDKHVERYKKWGKTDFKDPKRWNQEKYFDKLSLDKMNSITSCIREASKYGLIEIYIEKDPYTFYLGKLLSVDRKTARFKLVNKYGKWTRIKSYAISEIDFIIFDTRYCRKFNKKMSILPVVSK